MRRISSRARGTAALVLSLGASLGACTRSTPTRELDLDLVHVQAENARLRTDSVGVGKFEETSAFVLVDAENTSSEHAYVTLGGELIDGAGQPIGKLRKQSLYVPAHATRTFALVDTERVPRPSATSAKIVVTGAQVATEPPRTHVDDVRTSVDENRIVVQGYLVNEVDKLGQAIVIASFHDANQRPMKRPFMVLRVAAKRDSGDPTGECTEVGSDDWPSGSRCFVQFVGPPGSKTGTIYTGDVVY